MPPACPGRGIDWSLLLCGSHLVCLWPAVVLLHITGFEPFVISLSAATDGDVAVGGGTGSYSQLLFEGLGMNVVLALVVNLLSTHAMNLTTPVFSGAGMALTIPASVVADIVLHGDAVSSVTQWAGILSIVAGFFGLVLDTRTAGSG